MIKLFQSFILLFLFIPNFCFTQKIGNGKIVSTSTGTGTHTTSGRTTQEEEIHEYNPKGRLVSITSMVKSGITFWDYTEYDTIGNVVLSISKTNDKIHTYMEKTYDHNHNLILSKEQKPFTQNHDTINTQYIYNYHEDGRNATGLKLENQDTVSVVTIQVTNQTKTITEEPFHKMEFPWKGVTVIRLNDEGKILSHHWHVLRAGQNKRNAFDTITIRKIEFDMSGRLILEELVDRSALIARDQYEYNLNGVIRKKHTDMSGVKELVFIQTFY